MSIAKFDLRRFVPSLCHCDCSGFRRNLKNYTLDEAFEFICFTLFQFIGLDANANVSVSQFAYILIVINSLFALITYNSCYGYQAVPKCLAICIASITDFVIFTKFVIYTEYKERRFSLEDRGFVSLSWYTPLLPVYYVYVFVLYMFIVKIYYAHPLFPRRNPHCTYFS